MNCEQANEIDLVDYLNSLGFQPEKIRGNDYWYLSPLRNERTASFKIERNKNVWYDHGPGTGGRMIDFVRGFYHCDVSEALKRISSFHQPINFKYKVERPPHYLQENPSIRHKDASQRAIKVIGARQPMEDPWLCHYLKQRRIPQSIADTYCFEVEFTNGEKEKVFKAIGFKNNAGGYELRNEYFKGSSSPKYITFLNNKANNLTVFEGFFDFMSYQTLHQNQEQQLTNFLVLNSLSFFERSLLLMEKYDATHLYLDRDPAGRKHTAQALRRSAKFKDESGLYKGYKDLNHWIVNWGKQKNIRPFGN